MKRLIEFPLDDGDVLLVEVDVEASPYGLEQVARDQHGEGLPEKAVMTFYRAMDKVKPAAEAIIQRLRGLSEPPDEMEVEFGIKLSAEAGAVVASTGMSANYTVKLKWKKDTKA